MVVLMLPSSTPNSSTGELTFKSAPDYENPIDNGSNNSYEVKVRATDSEGNTVDQSLLVNILDFEEDDIVEKKVMYLYF